MNDDNKAEIIMPWKVSKEVPVKESDSDLMPLIDSAEKPPLQRLSEVRRPYVFSSLYELRDHIVMKMNCGEYLLRERLSVHWKLLTEPPPPVKLYYPKLIGILNTGSLRWEDIQHVQEKASPLCLNIVYRSPNGEVQFYGYQKIF